MSKKTGSSRDSRSTSTARLAAVQGLYEIELTGAQLDDILMDFMSGRWISPPLHDDDRSDEQNAELAPPDKKKFGEVVRGVLNNKDNLDQMIQGTLSENRTTGKLDTIMLSILRAGAFELLELTTVPPKVIINEYVNMAHAFYSESEPGFVNGVLDRLAKVLRQQELEN